MANGTITFGYSRYLRGKVDWFKVDANHDQGWLQLDGALLILWSKATSSRPITFIDRLNHSRWITMLSAAKANNLDVRIALPSDYGSTVLALELW